MTERPLNITDLSISQLDDLVLSMGEPLFRAKQIRKWVYQKLASSYDEMMNLPAILRLKLKNSISLQSLSFAQQVTSTDGTIKTLFKCFDGNSIESALMFYENNGEKKRRTVCISTQAGCAIGCSFCATGQQGFIRNLTPGEIIDQVLYFARILEQQTVEKNIEHISNIVFMGMGEPLSNYDNLWQAILTLNSPECFRLGARNITISTCGIVPGIQRLSKEKLQIGLAVSLHAAENSLRNTMVPINKKYPLEELIPACREYSKLTGRRISFEYILVQNLNDSLKQAQDMVGLLDGFDCHVNLIPANNTELSSYSPPPMKVVLAFKNELLKNHVNVTLRESRGRDIDAGCGQLKSRYISTIMN